MDNEELKKAVGVVNAFLKTGDPDSDTENDNENDNESSVGSRSNASGFESEIDFKYRDVIEELLENISTKAARYIVYEIMFSRDIYVECIPWNGRPRNRRKCVYHPGSKPNDNSIVLITDE
jgi:hypothetical protein